MVDLRRTEVFFNIQDLTQYWNTYWEHRVGLVVSTAVCAVAASLRCTPVRLIYTRGDMASERVDTALEEQDSSDLDLSPDHECHISKRHARVTVKYNRKELKKRLDVERWIDDSLDQLYSGQVGPAYNEQASPLFKNSE